MGARSLDGNFVASAIDRASLSMAELDDIPQPARERLERVGAIELVVGILGTNRRAELDGLLPVVREAVGPLSPAVRTVVVHSDSPADQGSGNTEPAERNGSL